MSVDTEGSASLCGLGQMAGGPIDSACYLLGEELARLAGEGNAVLYRLRPFASPLEPVKMIPVLQRDRLQSRAVV